MSEDTYAKLTVMRRAEGVPSIAALFLKKCGVLDDEQTADEIVVKAIQKASRKPTGEVFTLKSLFGPEEWESFAKGARLKAGKRFYDRITARPGFQDSGKTTSNHQRYTKR